MKQWTHRYKFKIKTTSSIGYAEHIHTGQIQVSRKYTNEEVFKLANKMSHSTLTNGKLVEVFLIETQ